MKSIKQTFTSILPMEKRELQVRVTSKIIPEPTAPILLSCKRSKKSINNRGRMGGHLTDLKNRADNKPGSCLI